MALAFTEMNHAAASLRKRGHATHRSKKDYERMRANWDELRDHERAELWRHEALADDPPGWAKDSRNDNQAFRCPLCGWWMQCVRPGKVQCDNYPDCENA